MLDQSTMQIDNLFSPIESKTSATHFCRQTVLDTRELLKQPGLALRINPHPFVFYPDINRIAQAAITNGCGGGMYCPAPSVTREEMASFLSRALGLPAAPADYFWDDTGSPHEDAINRLAAAGITNGCGGGKYCPSQSVTREEMAAFLHRAFD